MKSWKRTLSLAAWCPMIAGGLFGIGGCSSSSPPVPVEKQWASAIRNYAFIPVYPMREDVMVGDINLVVEPNAVEGRGLTVRRLGYVEGVNPVLEEYYKLRKPLPKTNLPQLPESGDGSRSLQPFEQPTDETGLFSNSNPDANVTRPRLAALPGVNVAQLTAGQLGGRFPVGAADIGGAIAGENSVALTISLTGIEEISSPNLGEIHDEFAKWCQDNDNRNSIDPIIIKLTLNSMLSDMSDMSIEEARPRAVVNTRVLYARSIDYTTSNTSGLGAQLAAAQGLSALQAFAPKPSSANPQTPSAGSDPKGDGAQGADSITQLNTQLLAQAQQLLGNAAAAQSPGVSASFMFADSRGLTLREIFERPLAFAVEAMAYDADYRQGRHICDELTSVSTDNILHR